MDDPGPELERPMDRHPLADSRFAVFAAVAAVAVGLVAGAGDARAQYRYGGYSGSEESGFFLFLEGGIGNPRNADPVVATQEAFGAVQSYTRIRPAWDDEASGRIGGGWVFGNGNRVSASFWTFQTETRSTGDGLAGGLLDFAVGPPIQSGGSTVGAQGNPGYHDILTEIEATSGSIAFGRNQEVGDRFDLDWSIGLRFASFEETVSGVYDEAASTSGGFGTNRFDALKSIQSDMVGLEAALKGTWHLTGRWAVSGGFGFSQLEGEIDSFSSLAGSGSANSGLPSSYAEFVDDSRSGRILDFDARLIWRTSSDRLRLWLGWEQSTWDEIPSDRLRNFPGTAAPLPDRDSVGFSMVKLGGQVRF